MTPCRDRGGSNKEALGRLPRRPATGRPKLQDGHPLQGRIVGTAMGRNPLHPGILDAPFLPEEGQFVVQTVDLGPAPSAAVSIVRGAGDHGCEGVVAEGQDLEDGGLGPALPREGWRPAPARLDGGAIHSSHPPLA